MGKTGSSWEIAERIGNVEVPIACEERIIDDVAEGMEEEDANKLFYARIGAYVVGKARGMTEIFNRYGQEITIDTMLENAPKLTAIMELSPSHYHECGELGFFIKALMAAIEQGYVDKGLQLTDEGKEFSGVAIEKEAAYN